MEASVVMEAVAVASGDEAAVERFLVPHTLARTRMNTLQRASKCYSLRWREKY